MEDNECVNKSKAEDMETESTEQNNIRVMKNISDKTTDSDSGRNSSSTVSKKVTEQENKGNLSEYLSAVLINFFLFCCKGSHRVLEQIEKSR